MRIIAIRHGETALNIDNRLTGWLDEGLTGKGRAEALAAAHSLATDFTTDFQVILCSPMLRTTQTAQIIADQFIAEKHPCRLVPDPDLRERNFGSLSGMTWEEIEAATGRNDLRHIDVHLMAFDYRPYGGEHVAEVTARVQQSLERAPALADGHDLLIVTHGGIIKLLYSLLESDGRKKITNCSAHVFYLPSAAAQAIG